VLTAYLGGDAVAGGKLKETGTAHWMSPNTGATNESGFTATPGANREGNGAYLGLGSNGVWWCSTGTNCLYIPYNDRNVSRFWSAAAHGFSVRCVKD
jgi:uncharacterized protein (TIGR02145 family)